MADCIFCKIIAKEIPAHIVYEDGHALAFLDIAPRAPGHTMVIPKQHAANILELPEPEIGPLFAAVKKVAGRLVTIMEADGLTIGINQGDVSGQTVKHLHVHLMPRFEGDGGGSVHSVVENTAAHDLAKLAAAIRF